MVSVDGVHCRIREVRKDLSAKWFDHNSHGAGLAYENGIPIQSGNLVWIKGPFPASTHDFTIFRGEVEEDETLTKNADPAQPQAPAPECLRDKIKDGQRTVGDTGYRGERPGDSHEVKKFKARVKSRQETFNGRIKWFNVLNTAFPHAISRHQECFESVCVAAQYDIENEHPLFEV